MKNALDFFGTKDVFDFGSWPIFKTWLGDLQLMPTNFTDSPKVNVKETDKAYEIEIANPGFGKDDTKIEVKDGMINVSMMSESKEGEEDKKYHVKQWKKSSYNESWYLPENVIQDQITATHNDGVLVITLPKKKEEPKNNESRVITIE